MNIEEQLAKAESERDEARANYQWMVNRACDEKLEGYRELAAKCAQLEEERDEARAEVERLEVACHAWAEDMREAARLCEQAGNEMPIDAVRRFVSSKAAIVDMLQDRLSESRAEVGRLMHQLADATNESTHFRVMCKRETEEVERLTSELQRERKCLTETRRELASQYGMGFRRGAEAMREACARVADAHCVPGTRDVIRALPIPEET